MLSVTFDHIHLRSPNPKATAEWFRDMLECDIAVSGERAEVKLGGSKAIITSVVPGDGTAAAPVTPYTGLDHFGLTVTDIDAVAKALEAKGVAFSAMPQTIRPGVRVCFLRGPEGISIELLERDPKYT